MEPIILVVVLIMFIAAAVQGIAGFGRALIAAPLVALILPASDTVVIMIVMGTVSGAAMVVKNRKNIHIKKVIPMIALGIAGVLIGVRILENLPVRELKIVMGGFIILSAIILATGFRVRIKNDLTAYTLAGFIGGLTTGAISFGGPPTVLFLQNQNEQKNAFRANLSIYFMIVGIAGSINLYLNGMLYDDLLVQAAIYAVPTVAGTIFGHFLSHRFNEEIFRKVVIGVLFASGIMAIVMSVIK